MDSTTEEGISTLLEISTGFLRVFIQHSLPILDHNLGIQLKILILHRFFQDLSTQLGGAILFSKLIISIFCPWRWQSITYVVDSGYSSAKFEHSQAQMHSPIEYSAIKSGVISITKWLAKYYADANIRVNCISPGGILDGQPHSFLNAYRSSCTNIGMIGADQVAAMALFLLSHTSTAVNGQNFVVDDGWSL